MYRYTAFWPYGLGRKMVHLVLKGRSCFVLVQRTSGEETLERRDLAIPSVPRYFVSARDLDYQALRTILAKIHKCHSSQVEIRVQGERHSVSPERSTGPAHWDEVRTPSARW